MTPKTQPEPLRPEGEGNRLVGIPGFGAGGLVERTGVALVHEGEYILPAPGSEAVLSPASEGLAGQVINYYFPIEVEVVGALSTEQVQRVAAFVYAELRTELDSWGKR